MSFSFKKMKMKIAKYFKHKIRRWKKLPKDRKLEELQRANILTNYFARKYITKVNKLKEKPATIEKPQIIWQFWDNVIGKITPEIVKVSFKSVEKFKGNFEHKILNNSNLENYSDLPGYVFDRLKNGNMIYAHFADLLRLNLLKNHGGIWMDATIYITSFIPQNIVNEDFFVFLTDKLTKYPYSFMQNCFIRAKKDNYLCEAWYQICIEYWKKEMKSIDYFQHQLMFKALVSTDLRAKVLYDRMLHESEDKTLQIHNKLFEAFDSNEWEKIINSSFLHKTTYKRNEIWVSAVDYPNTFFSKLCEI